MNQKVLIVFTLFLLITILLLLLLSDAKAKSSRTRVLVTLCGHPLDSTIMDTINYFLEKMASENNFIFTIADDTYQLNARSPDSYAVLLQLQSPSFSGEGNKESINLEGLQVIQIDVGQHANRCNDPDFLIQVRDAILRVVSSMQQNK